MQFEEISVWPSVLHRNTYMSHQVLQHQRNISMQTHTLILSKTLAGLLYYTKMCTAEAYITEI